MATVNIPSPVLSTGMHFKVRYRSLPGGSWVTLANQTNAPFDIIGLAAGQYELEVVVVIDDDECPPTSWFFDVQQIVEHCDCLTEASGVMLYAAGVRTLKITYTLPTPQPDCGWIVEYGPFGGIQQTITYATLPAGQLILPATSSNYSIKIFANCCDGVQVECYSATIPNYVLPSCTKGTFMNVAVYYAKPYGNRQDRHLRVFLTNQSTPPSTQITVNYVQRNLQPGTSTGAPDSGSVTIPIVAGQSTYWIPINPNVSMCGNLTSGGNGPARDLNYDVVIIDACGSQQLFCGGTYWV